MRRLWKITKTAPWIILGILVVDAGLVLGMGQYQHPEKIPKSDAIVVLGAAINSRAANNRALAALELYQQGKSELLVLSGGRISDADITEARYMEKVIVKNAADLPKIILEENSHSTYENLKNVRAKIGPTKSLIVVTDKFHIARTVLMAKREGFAKVYWASPQNPTINRRELRSHYLREMLAMLDYIPKFILG